MPATKSLTITLPAALAERVQAKVAAGDYASESDVVQDGLNRLLAQDAEIESWLRNEVAGAYDRHQQNPSRTIPAEEILARLEQRFVADVEAAKRDT